MSHPFAAMFDGLFASDMAEAVDVDWNDQTISPAVPALVRVPRVVGEFGDVQMRQDARVFEIRVVDLLRDPERGHKIISCGRTYELHSTPHKDRLGLVWVIDAYLISA